MRFAGLILDFDGVLIESEALSNQQLVDLLTALGHPITPAASMAQFMGLAGPEFRQALEAHIGGPVPTAFHQRREVAEEQAMRDGIAEVAGATAFVRALPADLPVAIASSSPTRWIAAHLAHLGLSDRFDGRIFSGREHVARGKPAPDLYLHAAAALGVPIERCAIVEDSPVGATGAVASGGFVIGLCAGGHCDAGHSERLRTIGVQAVAADFGEVAALLAGA